MSKKEATINQVLEVVQASQVKSQTQFERVIVELGDLKKNGATKEDLKNFATRTEVKGMLKDFATKSEVKDMLKGFATRDDLKRFSTSEEVASLGEFLQGQIHDLRDEMKVGFYHLESRLTNRIDRFERRIFEGNNAFAENLSDHEDRITYLEKNPQNA